jgi:hypothetical protein
MRVIASDPFFELLVCDLNESWENQRRPSSEKGVRRLSTDDRASMTVLHQADTQGDILRTHQASLVQ